MHHLLGFPGLLSIKQSENVHTFVKPSECKLFLSSFMIPSTPKTFRVVAPTCDSTALSATQTYFPKYLWNQQLSFCTYIKSVTKHLIEYVIT